MHNLVAALGSAGHRADLVRLPVAWEKGRLFDSALAWRMLPVDADLVVATNFPSYYVRHPRKVVWLFHQHRGAYDAVDAGWSDIGLDDTSLEVQRQLTEWDARALGEAHRVFTTSGVVADRLARFNGLRGEPLYHPPPLHDSLHPGPFGDYVFVPTRLEANKRPELVVEAVAAARGGVRAVIAGRGGMRGDLEARAAAAGVAERVELPGFVSDDRLVELYAGALAVVYAPFDEDYGYVTLQAFYAGKPVITACDAGGVLEWVEDGVNGIITDGSREQLGRAVDRFAEDPALAERMGAAGLARVADLSWDHVVTTLLPR
ncbi:glycosyltransferase family 4 protein [Pseudonocardia sp. K10HN5]|uniref:Glycosyltransferase family 4 protein n=2 Tax=Pseudonocardia acidicola TaxID=2724939 RepID=A0ABX1SB56_9PSEU|nr:glycosyltransferase family 4 protein [Pseudonocardia acidicola]